MRAGGIVCVALIVLAFSLGQARAQQTPPASPEAFYVAAVDSMRALPQPHYLTYIIEGEGDNLGIDLAVVNHLVWLQMTTGSDGSPALWSIRHRTDDYASEISGAAEGRLVSTRAFFDPTWYGAFRALREGMLDYQKTDPSVSSYATPTPGPPSDLRTIAVVEVMGSNIYSVVDKGPATCSDGAPGHALHLIPRDRDPRHQLADVVVNLRNMHFCTMRFNASALGFRGSVEQHYSTVGGYWLQTDGIIESGVRTFGIMTGHGVWRYRLDQMSFPRSIPAEAFVPPDYQ